MLRTPTRFSSLALSLYLALGVSHAVAQPPENRGKPDSHPGKHGQETRKPGHSTTEGRGDIDIEEALIREIFREHHASMAPAASLPPGIQKKLARGKPLPPGIAKRFDDRLQSRLPTYPGYDWRQVGTDAVLIDITSGIVEAIIADVLR